MASIGARIGAIKGFVSSDTKKANIELDNLYQSLSFIISNLSPKHRAFVCTIKSINGRLIHDEDLTESGIDKILKELETKKITYSILDNAVNLIKKNFESEFETFFPDLSSDGNTIVKYENLKDLGVLYLKKIQTKSEELKSDIDKQIGRIEEFFNDAFNPSIYHGADGVEVRLIKSFEDSCTMLEAHKFTTNAKGLMTISFYQKLQQLKKQLIKNKK